LQVSQGAAGSRAGGCSGDEAAPPEQACESLAQIRQEAPKTKNTEQSQLRATPSPD